MNKFFSPFNRLYRYLTGKCLVCGRNNKRIRYCSIECMAMGGGIHYVTYHPVKSIFFGHTDNYKKHFKYKNEK